MIFKRGVFFGGCKSMRFRCLVNAFAFKLDLKNLVVLITTFILGSKASAKLERQMSY